MRLVRVRPDDPRVPGSVAGAARVGPGLYRCLFFEVHAPGILTANGSSGSVVLCSPASKTFSRFIVLTEANALAPGKWDVRTLMARSAMPAGIVVSLLSSFSGFSWSELASPIDQHGAFSAYGRPDDLLPMSAERIPPSLDCDPGDYRWLLNVLDPDTSGTVKEGGVKVGPTPMAKHFGVVESHMPRVYFLDGGWYVEYKTFAEVLIVYGAQAAAGVLQRYVEIDGVVQPVPGCTIQGSVVTLTLETHFNLARGRSKQMWYEVRERAAGILREEATPFIRRAGSGELVEVMPQNANGESPNAREICVALILIAIAERKRHKMADVLAEAQDYPLCLRLDPVSWYDSNNFKVRRQQLLTVTGLEFDGHKEMADRLRLVIENVYETAYQPRGVSDADFNAKQRIRRRSLSSRAKTLYRSPKCSECPLGFKSAEGCMPTGTYDRFEHTTVARVIVGNAEARAAKAEKQEGEAALEAAEEIALDQYMSTMKY